MGIRLCLLNFYENGIKTKQMIEIQVTTSDKKRKSTLP